MKTSGVIICCVLAAITLSCESAHHQVLNSINDLKRIHLRQSLPQHSIFLLYWFADTVRIDHYGTTVRFDPNKDYGSHHYGNYESMLDQPPWGHQYYTVGNLNTDRYNALPHYIRSSDRGNTGRVIFSAETSGAQTRTIDQVYFTQHVGSSSTEYDPAHTYQISTNMLREISQIPNPNELWRRLQPWYDTPHLQSSYSHRGTDLCECVCLALVILVMLIVVAGLLIIQAPKR